MADEKKTIEGSKSKGTTLSSDVVGFLGFAVITYIYYTAILISGQDILASTNIASSTIIMCFNTPYFTMTLILPYFIDKLSLMAKAVGSALFFGLGVVIITLIHTPLRLAGVIVASFGMGIAEIGFLSATSLHEDFTIHSFTCGTGLGAIMSTLYMTGMTTLACVRPSVALQILLILLPIFPLLAWHINRKSNQSTSKEFVATTHGSKVEFTQLLTEQEASSSDEQVNHQPLSWKEKFSAAYENMHLAAPLYLGLFADYMSMQAIITTIAFENAPFDPRDHFHYYVLVFWAAEIIGRSYGIIILLFNPNRNVVTRKTWIFTVIIVADMIVLAFASWYRFLPNFPSAAVLVAVIGLTEGALYLNTFAVAGKDSNARPRYREFSRAFLTCALQGGIVTAAFLGLFVEPKLKEHCLEIMAPHGSQCLTRLAHGQFNATSSCLL